MKKASEMKRELKEKIVAGKCTRQDVEMEMQRIVDAYGPDAFPPYLLVKKEKPWDQRYLDELASLAGFGAGSQEFFLHMQEVKAEIVRKRRNLQYAVAECIAAVSLIAVIIALLARK